MRRTLNVRVLLILLLVLGLVGTGAYFLHNWQVNRQIEIFIQKADQATADKDPQKAREYLEKYLLLRPDKIEVLNRHAFLMDDSARNPPEKARAYLALEKALRKYKEQQGATQQQPPAELYKRAAMRAHDLGRFRDAMLHLEPLLRLTPQEIDLKVIKAKCHMGLTQVDEAKKLYDEILAAAPQHIKSYEALKDIHLFNKDPEAAEKCLKQMVELNAQSLEARSVLIKFYRKQGKLNDATRENDIAQKLISAEKADPADKIRADLLHGSAQLALAQINPDDKAQSEKKIAEALQYYSQGMREFPKDVRFFIGKAQLDLGRGKAGKTSALDLLHQAVPLVGDEPDDQWMVAKLLLDAGDKPQAVKLISELRAKHGATPVMEYMRARFLYDEGKVGEAVSIQERIKDGLSRIPPLAIDADIWLASAYQVLGNPDRRLAAFERILKANPAIAAAHAGKAESLVALGRNAEALEIYRKLLPREPVVRFPLIRLLIATEQKKPVQQRNWTEIKTLLDNCTAEEKKTKDYSLTAFQLSSSTQKLEDVEKAVGQGCRDNPKEAFYWIAKLALIRQRPGLDDKARASALEQTLQEAERALGDHVELRLARASTTSALPRDKVLPALEALEHNTEKWSPADQITLGTGLANIYYSMGYSKDAKRLLARVLELSPSNYPALQFLADVSIEEKDDTETLRLIKVLQDLEGEEGYRWRWSSLNRLFAKLQAGERSVYLDARKLLDELSKLRPSWNQIATAQGRLLELNGQVDQAIEQFKRAIDQGERNPDIIKRTVQLLTMRRRPEEARDILKLVMESNAALIYTKLDAEVSLRSSDTPAQTLAKAKQAVRADSKDFRDHLWLGNVQWAAEDKSGAEASFKQAVSLGKDQPEAWASWLVYLIKSDRKSEAAAELKVAETALKDKATYVLIAYYQALDQRDKAEEYYVKLVDSNPSDIGMLQGLVAFHFRSGDFAKAEALLKKQLDSSLIDAVTLNWARRSYALTLAAKPDYQSFKDALALVEKNLKENATSPEDLRTRALVLSTRPGPRQDIIKDLESSFAFLKPSPNEAILLAQLYEDEGNWPKASSILAEMVAVKEGEAPNFLAYYIQALVRHKELALAAKWMEKLEAKSSGQPITIEPKAKLLFAEGKSQQAIELLESEANKLYNQRKDATIFLYVSNLLDQSDQKQAAEKMAKQFVKEGSAKNPTAVLSLVALYSRQGRITEAISVCEENWSKLPVGNVAMACVAALNTGKATPQEMQRIETRLVTESKAAKFDVGVAIALADLYRLQKRPAESEALYRKILEHEKDHPIALNNLAWHLSDHPEAYNEAIQLVTRAIDRYGPEGAFLDTRGMIFQRNGKSDQAIKDLEDSVTKAPSTDHWLHLAYAQHKARNASSAEKSWKKALALGLKADKLSPADQGYFHELERSYKP